MSARSLSLLLGKCVPSVKKNAAKVCVTRMELDDNLLMYYRKVSYVYAHDPEAVCKTGDIVLIEELPQKLSRLVTHGVREIVFPLGDVVDPITGQRVSGTRFRSELEEENTLYGEAPERFRYDTAPPRGWQEGKKDFTDKDTYIKYHEIEGDDQPYGV
ncbi:hypothetical protein AAG570_006487 [Ranatra chinensis]|uniref:Mitochondrial ribosomal protein S17 n=1 Tax=Ranatra chinensis TaxID=642074 RepID=A0ABD0YW99_9HEMI